MSEASEAPAAVPVHRAHVLARRARLRPAAPMEREALVALAESLAAVAGVDRVLARPTTGSLIVETHHDAAEVLAEMEAQGLIRTRRAPSPPPVGQVARLGLLQADMGVKRRTGNALDLRTAMALALAAGAVLQLARGRVAGPATTLAMAAFSLLDRDAPKG
jgi:hypothetical protein